MISTLPVKIEPQFIEYSETEYDGLKLHKIQEIFYNFNKLPAVSIITAPTGTGKSFAFPLPLVQRPELSKLKGMIISPTNALIENMKADFQETFPNIKTEILNAKRLDELEAKGRYNRWNTILETIDESDLIITNPDLLNYAMMGGYFIKKNVTQRQWTEIFEKTNYFVFDEYHLYDEEQIANILSWQHLSSTLFPKGHSKFIFASATPEPGLQEYFQNKGIQFATFLEKITERGRKIHGELDIQFIKGIEIDEFMVNKKSLIYDFVSKNEKILVLFDSLVQLHRVENKIKTTFNDLHIEVDTGYETRSAITPDLKNAQIILGTNKLEVGVNLHVDVCLMQPGRYFRNFVQRLGRIARGDKFGNIFIFVNKINKLKKEFLENEVLSYYEFIEKAGNVYKDKKFYTEKIPQFMGCAFYVIKNNVTDYTLKWKVLKNKLAPDGLAKSFNSFFIQIDIGIKKLDEINKNNGYGYSSDLEKWKLWWNNYLKTFKWFRGGSINCKIIDLDRKDTSTREYSLEWILKNKIIQEIKEENGEKIYYVHGLRDDKPELAQIVNSLPVPGISNNIIFDKERYRLKEAYTKRLFEVQKFYEQRKDEFGIQCLKIIGLLEKIKPIFNEKRLNVEEIISDSNII